MEQIVGVRFKKGSKVYYFNPTDRHFDVGTKVIVETARGVECGTIVISNRDYSGSNTPIKEVIREVNQDDLNVLKANKKKEKEAFKVCEQKIALRKLNMKLIDVECTFDNNKLLFYFTSETRVDFRELVKDLASIFRTRIELRQIGVRDECKSLGGLGICGREFCCKSYLGEFQPVSIKMVKEQGLSLNPTKISGACGRLMCCLKYEQEGYEQLLNEIPKIGAIVKHNNTEAYVEDINALTGKIKIKPKNSDVPIIVNSKEVELIKDAEIRINKEERQALKSLEDNNH